MQYSGRRTAQLPVRTYGLPSDELKGTAMDKKYSFKFLDKELNRELVRLFKKCKIDHSIGTDGTVHYSPDNEEVVGNNLICSIRDKVFSSWQVLTCPPDWTARYQEYMGCHGIPFREELSNGELWFLLPRQYRPHSWKLDGSKRKILARKR
jgi:hypothetical protein